MGLFDKLKGILSKPAAPPPQAAFAPAGAKPAGASSAPPAAGAGAADDDSWRARALFEADPAVVAAQMKSAPTALTRRRDLVPPQSDPRTAALDADMVQRGLISPDELAALHQASDAFLPWHDAAAFAAAAADAGTAAAARDLAAARAAQKAEKQERARARAEGKRIRVAWRKDNDILFLGRGVSHALGDRTLTDENAARLARDGLPALSSPKDVADFLGIGVPMLRHLAFHADVVTRPHYVQLAVQKKSGGVRTLHAPLPRMAAAQRRILDGILMALPPSRRAHDAAHGFVPGRSTVTNAKPHTGKAVVVNVDLVEFFPSLTLPRVRGVFLRMGYPPAVATVLSLLCTACERRPVELDGARLFVATRERALPQGACTSPALSNLCAHRLDRRVQGAARALGFAYTRYADDLTFSAADAGLAHTGTLLSRVRRLVSEEGFTVHERKVAVQKASTRQEVTGVVVNQRVGVPRPTLRRLRAILHRAKTEGLEAQNREGHENFEAWLRGTLAYVQMVDPIKGALLQEQLDELTGA